MDMIINVFLVFVACLHLYFLWFEMFAWETVGKKVFRSFPKELFGQTKSMAANQGLYNGFLAAGLIWSIIIKDDLWSDNVSIFFLCCVIVAGLYGAVTVSKKIFYVQALPAIVCIVMILLR